MVEEVETKFDRTAYNKEYYLKNKEKHRKYYAEKIVCEGCGATHTRSTKSNHLKSKKHLDGVKFNNLKKEKEENDYERLERKYNKMKKLVNRFLSEN